MVLKTIEILDVPIHTVTQDEAVKEFLRYCDDSTQTPPNRPLSRGGVKTATPNAEILLEAHKNPELKKYLQQCELNLADSVSLLWAGAVVENGWSNMRAIAELLFLPFRKSSWTAFPETVSGSDFFLEICKTLNEKRSHRIFLLGGEKNVAQKAKLNLLKQYQNLEIVGATDGSPLEKDDAEMVAEINKTKPDILFLAYGCPKQELWIARNLKKCPTVKVAMGVGGTFDFVAGKIKRAPKFLQKLGLEWLWRLILQPSRIGRILRAVFIFPYIFLKNRKK